MFCPKCGTQNLEEAKFCRACGADIHLVPHALAGRLAHRDDDEDDDDLITADDKYSYERGVRKLVTGACYLVAFVVMVVFFREFWWFTFWFIFPAISKISSGAGILAHASQERRRLGGSHAATREEIEARVHRRIEDGLRRAGINTAAIPNANATRALPNLPTGEASHADTAEIVPPPASVTEGTTRHLNSLARNDD